MNDISMKLNADNLILLALQEDITSEDITTNAVMRQYRFGEVELICKEDGVIAGLDVFKRFKSLVVVIPTACLYANFKHFYYPPKII